MNKKLVLPFLLTFFASSGAAFGAADESPGASFEQESLDAASQTLTDERLPSSRSTLFEAATLPDGFRVDYIRSLGGSDTLFFESEDGVVGDLTITGDPDVIAIDVPDVIKFAVELLKMLKTDGDTGGGGGGEVCVDQTIKAKGVTVTTRVCSPA